MQVGEDSHEAVFQAPESADEVRVTAAHADDREVEETTMVPVRENCRCHFKVEIRGFSSWSGRFDPESRFAQDMPLLEVMPEDQKAVLTTLEMSGGRSATVTPREGYAFPEGALSEGTTRFPAWAGASDPDIPVMAILEDGMASLEWFDPFEARITVSGIAKVCDEGEPLGAGQIPTCREQPREGPELHPAFFEMTVWPAVRRHAEEGSGFRMGTCDGRVVELGATSTRRMIFPGRFLGRRERQMRQVRYEPCEIDGRRCEWMAMVRVARMYRDAAGVCRVRGRGWRSREERCGDDVGYLGCRDGRLGSRFRRAAGCRERIRRGSVGHRGERCGRPGVTSGIAGVRDDERRGAEREPKGDRDP
jgi:hypothetical protein